MLKFSQKSSKLRDFSSKLKLTENLVTLVAAKACKKPPCIRHKFKFLPLNMLCFGLISAHKCLNNFTWDCGFFLDMRAFFAILVQYLSLSPIFCLKDAPKLSLYWTARLLRRTPTFGWWPRHWTRPSTCFQRTKRTRWRWRSTSSPGTVDHF